MELPIAKSDPAGPASLVRAASRARVILGRAVVDETILDIGTAFHKPGRQGVADANFIADAHLSSGRTAVDLVNEASEWFRNQGCACLEWQNADETWTPELSTALTDAGFVPYSYVVHRLASAIAPTVNPDVQIIPGRAAYPQLHAYYRAHAQEHDGADEDLAGRIASTRIDQLDEPRYDVFLARIAGKAFGAVGVVTLGPVGVVHDLFTLSLARGQGVGKTLMAHVLDYCARAQFESVIVPAPHRCPAEPLYKALGFVPAARFTVYRPD